MSFMYFTNLLFPSCRLPKLYSIKQGCHVLTSTIYVHTDLIHSLSNCLKNPIITEFSYV